MWIFILFMWAGGWMDTGISKQRNLVIYFEDDGRSQPIYPTAINPTGIYINNRTYIVYQATANLDPYVVEKGNNWSDPIQVGTNPLANDDHGCPSILIDTAGYFHVFYGCHVTFIQHAKSTNPNDISAWTDKGNIGNAQSTYPQPILSNDGDIYVFFRSGTQPAGEESYIKSTDLGESWGGVTAILAFGAAYSTGYGTIRYESDSNRIHYAWCAFDNGTNKRINTYHAYLDLSDNNMYSMDGTNMGATITKVEADANCLIYNSGANQANMPSLRVYNGFPYVIFNTDDTGWKWKFSKWNGLSWDAPVNITTTDHFHNHGDFTINATNDIDVYLTASGQAGRGGDMEWWKWNGASWNKVKIILSENTEWEPLNHPQIIKDFDSKLKLIFIEQTPDVYTTPVKIFAYRNSGFVKKEVQ